eukprot:TRINITY_DN17606_c0_g3_i3.p1 TRINITY_DN17606_c0_g3~~TRINITY_DN17606_c0_g3_i3.p1  ORF type:complete len:316 (+),score=57.29 TRINITY_DN17606_c0_g3_i3:138-950(+)
MSDGRLYLSAYSHHVVDVVDAASGHRVTRYGAFKQHGQAVVGRPAQFYCPYDVAVDETRGRVYVVDELNRCVVVRQCDGVVEAVWGCESSDQLPSPEPCGLAYCPATDQLYVADRNHHCIKVLRGADGQCVQVIFQAGGGANPLYFPSGVAVDFDHIYLADRGLHRVLVYAKQTGAFLFDLAQDENSGNTPFNGPYDVSVDSEAGVVYVADTDNHRVCVYRSYDGSYVRHFQVLQADQNKAAPRRVMWDAAAGVLYVTLCNSTNICVYES